MAIYSHCEVDLDDRDRVMVMVMVMVCIQYMDRVHDMAAFAVMSHESSRFVDSTLYACAHIHIPHAHGPRQHTPPRPAPSSLGSLLSLSLAARAGALEKAATASTGCARRRRLMLGFVFALLAR